MNFRLLDYPPDPGIHLKELNLFGARIGEPVLKAIGDLCPNLEVLELSKSNTSMESLRHIRWIP
jgi:hypothetical protein